MSLPGKDSSPYQGLKHDAQMVAVGEGAQHPDDVVLAAGICTCQLPQNGHLRLPGLGHDVVGADHLQGSQASSYRHLHVSHVLMSSSCRRIDWYSMSFAIAKGTRTGLSALSAASRQYREFHAHQADSPALGSDHGHLDGQVYVKVCMTCVELIPSSDLPERSTASFPIPRSFTNAVSQMLGPGKQANMVMGSC